MTQILEIQNLKKRYANFILHIENLSVESGEIIGIVGRNGSGKSTLLDLILNERKMDSGVIRIFGLDSIRDEVEIKKRLGFVIDDAGFDSEFTLAEAGAVLSFFYDCWDDSYFNQLLVEFDLHPHEKIKNLSAGMAVKGKLALALAHRPEVLFLDEITSGIDPVSRIGILKMLKDYIDSDPSRGLVYSTHITDDLKCIADKVLFIDKGSVISFNPTSFYGDSIDSKMIDYVENEEPCAYTKNTQDSFALLLTLVRYTNDKNCHAHNLYILSDINLVA